MRRWSSATLFIALALLVTAVASAQQDARPARVAGNRPECVSARAQPVFNGSGYNHLVTITNSCPAPVACQVTTNINPQAIRVSVASGASETVNTFFNAAGYGFAATVHCQSAAR
ncbi:MAG: hypothetical protein JNK05_00170 [Myxococcales bacterium]|nr:hypothetical protein [Myxococcales bacterium]